MKPNKVTKFEYQLKIEQLNKRIMALETQNAALAQTIAELAKLQPIERIDVQFKVSKNIYQTMHDLQFTRQEKDIIALTKCFDVNDSNQHQTLDFNCVLYALLQIHTNLTDAVSKEFSDRSFTETNLGQWREFYRKVFPNYL
jgi:uncharacterized coiled-coil protein SlyX